MSSRGLWLISKIRSILSPWIIFEIDRNAPNNLVLDITRPRDSKTQTSWFRPILPFPQRPHTPIKPLFLISGTRADQEGKNELSPNCFSLRPNSCSIFLSNYSSTSPLHRQLISLSTTSEAVPPPLFLFWWSSKNDTLDLLSPLCKSHSHSSLSYYLVCKCFCVSYNVLAGMPSSSLLPYKSNGNSMK